MIAFAIVGAALVLVVALVAVGGVVGRLRTEPARNIFENDEALEFVAQALPDEFTAELSYEELQRIMRLHLDYLHAQGVARSGGDLPAAGGPQVVDSDDAVRVDPRPRRAGGLLSPSPTRSGGSSTPSSPTSRRSVRSPRSPNRSWPSSWEEAQDARRGHGAEPPRAPRSDRSRPVCREAGTGRAISWSRAR